VKRETQALGLGSGDSLGGGVKVKITPRQSVVLFLLVAETPSGESRRRAYLSEGHAYDRAVDWRGRGWLVAVQRVEVDIPEALAR
jgi:hypothetical protein